VKVSRRSARRYKAERKAALRARAAWAPARKPGWRRQLSSAGVMTVVAGLVITVTLPAFAEQQSIADGTHELLAGQSLEVASSTGPVEGTRLKRDSYSATSAADLRALYAKATMEQNLADYLASGARELGDDYPWPAALSRDQGGGLSPLNYYYRECVDFVAWRLNRDAGTTSAPYRWTWSNLASGSAYAWKSEWQRHGWDTGSTPRAGAVAWFPGANHVAYVTGLLADGSVMIEEYNGMVKHGYAQRAIQPGDAYYLYAPPA
jgi:surface antigen